MRSIAVVVMIVIVLGAIPGATGAKPKELGPDNLVARFLEDCIVGPGREYRSLVVYPITLDGPVRAFPSVSLDEAHRKDEVALAEDKGGAGTIRGLGFGLETVLLLTGDVLVGGRADRMVVETTAIRPRTDIPIAVIPVERSPRRSAKKKTLKPDGYLAPPYLRMALHRGDPGPAVVRVLDHYESLLPKDAPVSLDGILRADRMLFLSQDYLDELESLPKDAGGRVIGVAAVVGGDPVLWETFGSPALFRAHWPRILTSLAFAASGHEIRDGSAGLPALAPPAQGPERFIPELKRVRGRLAGARIRPQKAGSLTGRYRIHGPRVVGSAVTGPAGLLHLAAFPYRTTDDAKYGKTLPAEVDPEDLERDPAVLLRREREGRLTAAEQRYLDRLRRRRGGNRGPDLPQPAGDGPRPVPGSDRPRPPSPDPNPPPPPPDPSPGGGGGGSGGGREDLPPSGGR